MKIIEKEYNVVTGVETITERDETSAEIAVREAFEVEAAQRQMQLQATTTARQAILDQLGITAEQAKLLLS